MEQSYVWVMSWTQGETLYGGYISTNAKKYKVFTNKQNALDFKYRLLTEGYSDAKLTKYIS